MNRGKGAGYYLRVVICSNIMPNSSLSPSSNRETKSGSSEYGTSLLSLPCSLLKLFFRSNFVDIIVKKSVSHMQYLNPNPYLHWQFSANLPFKELWYCYLSHIFSLNKDRRSHWVFFVLFLCVFFKNFKLWIWFSKTTDFMSYLESNFLSLHWLTQHV